MRVDTAANELHTDASFVARRSTIKTSRKTFRMVIDGIYSDKIGSICQEIAANAFDSHLRAKQDKAFYVHCPTMLRPEFFVRDYGVGMTDKIMEEVYIVLGESDKDMSDEEVGMWGLGSKSPFAYTDQYYITCYDGETARHYGYGIAEDGVPTLYLMQTEDCTEEKGVRVGFSVEAKDFPLFEAAIQRVSIGHAGAFESNVPLKNIGEVAFKGADWQSYRDSALKERGHRWFVRQGCILYPISPQHVTQPSDQSNITFILDCPIGTVRITTSREAIEYKEDVVTYLKARIEKVQEEVKDAIWTQVKDIESVVDFFTTVRTITPGFVNTANFIHPTSGLSKPAVDAAYPRLFFKASLSIVGRWEFSTPTSIALTAEPYGHSTPKQPEHIYVLDDVSPLLDPSRDTADVPTMTGWLTKSEMRRISRFTRSYLESLNVTDGMFFMNIDWEDSFWKACFPKAKVTKLTFDELRGAIPRRVVPPKEEQKQPIRGLALAKAAGEQKPVFEVREISAGDRSIAWVSSEQYRKQASTLFKLGRKFGIQALYIAAPGAQTALVDAGIMHMRDAMTAVLEARGLNFGDWYFAKERLTDYRISVYVKLLRTLLKNEPKSFERLANGVGEFSTIARTSQRLLATDLIEKLSEEDRKAVEALLVDDAGKSVKPPVPADLVECEIAMATIGANSYNNPTNRWVAGYNEDVTSPAKLKRIVTATLYLQKMFPPSEKFKG